MPRPKLDANNAVEGFKGIFQTGKAAVNSSETIQAIPLSELYPPEFHPFLVKDDSAMERLVKSVKQYGVREPGLARPRKDGAGTPCAGYELVAGNRRKRASELAGILTLPVIIRDMDDDDAAIAMVDSNIEQRETLLLSEKAWAYHTKMTALNHRGSKSETPGQLSVEILCEQTGESKNQIYRLIRLVALVPDLLDMVDAKKLAFNPAVEISHLTRPEQGYVVDIMRQYDMKPSLSQAQKLKCASQNSGLTLLEAEKILSVHLEKKPSENGKTLLKRFKGYFPDNFTQTQMESVIVELLKGWKANETVQAVTNGGEA